MMLPVFAKGVKKKYVVNTGFFKSSRRVESVTLWLPSFTYIGNESFEHGIVFESITDGMKPESMSGKVLIFFSHLLLFLFLDTKNSVF